MAEVTNDLMYEVLKAVQVRLEQGLGLGAIAALDFDVEHLALAHAGDPGQPERAQRAFDGLALRVENAGFQGDGDTGFHC